MTSTSSTISSTYSLHKMSFRCTSSKRKIMEVIEVDQLEDTNNKRLSWAMPHSGIKPKLEDTNNGKLSLGCPIKTKVVSIISATSLSHSISVGELPKIFLDKSEHPKGSHKPVEILAQNAKEMARKSEIFLFWP